MTTALVGPTELTQAFDVLGIADAPYLAEVETELLKQILIALCNS
jgi:hypothetical protein